MLQRAQFYFHFEEMDIAWLPVPLTTFHINIYIYIGLYIYIYRTRTFLDTCGSQQVFCLNMSTYNLYIYIYNVNLGSVVGQGYARTCNQL